MAKPAITKRAVKAAALTYAELDTNFQNLADATITVTAGSGGTAVTSDLNGNITLVAGTNVTLTGNNTAKTVTINSSGGDLVTDLSPQLGANLDLNGFDIRNDAGSVVKLSENNIGLGDATTNEVFIAGNTNRTLTIKPQYSYISVEAGVTGDILIRTYATTNGGSVFIGSALDQNSAVVIEDALKLYNVSTTNRDLRSPENGWIIYNSTTHKFQGYANGSWVDLH